MAGRGRDGLGWTGVGLSGREGEREGGSRSAYVPEPSRGSTRVVSAQINMVSPPKSGSVIKGEERVSLPI